MEARERRAADTIAFNIRRALASEDSEKRDFPPREGVYGRLFKEGYRFDFFQAVQLLEAYFKESPPPGESYEARRERVLFRPYPTIAFPASDVRTVEVVEEAFNRVRLEVTFMGLYGVASPLPVYFYEDIALQRNDTDPLRDFLDIFNHRIYAYFYRAWKKYRPAVNLSVTGKKRQTERLMAVTGLGTPGALRETPLPHLLRLAAFARWLAPRTRSVEGLQKFLSEMLEDVPVQIQQNVPRRVALPDRPRMGEKGAGGFAIGTSAVVGASVQDISGKFRVVLGPLSFEAYRAFLPGGARAEILDFLVRMYAPDYLDYDVELQLDTSQIPPVKLGAGNVRVGFTAWLGKPEQEITKHHVSYA